MSKSALAAIRTQVMWNRLIAVVEEQAQSLLRTAFGTITREAGDLSAGVYDTSGNMIAQAMTGTPGHVNTMATAVAHFFKHFPQSTMKPGDVYVTNDPWLGTGHLFDYVVMTPVFLEQGSSSPSSPPPAMSSMWAASACPPRPIPPSRKARSFRT